MLKKSLLLIICCFCLVAAAWSQTVSGTITDESGEPLIGVNILEKGTANGTVSDLDGSYSLNLASADAILVFSYTGYANQEVSTNGQSVVNVSMAEGVNIDEVVVTALGISREKKSLTYSAQNVNTEELGQARELNVVNSLSGKVAGISISPGGNGVGSASRVILRGNRSIAGSSEPLYVVDGVPILGDITDINPDDIASISVLKGPNAAALYGNRANNGAIIISTKQAAAGQTRVSVNTTYTSNSPIILTNYQNEFGQGNGGQYSPASEDSWGAAVGGTGDHWSQDPNFPESTYSLQAQPDNVRDFFQTGYNWATNLAISGGTDKMKTYFSYTYTDAQGVVPNNDLKRHNFHVRINNQISDKLTVDAKLNYIREDIDNSLSTGESFANPIRHALRLPRTIRTQDVSQFEYTDATGKNRQHYWNPGSNGGANPYWTINRNTNQRDVDRIIGLASLRYQFTDQLSVQV
ncbi:MAG: SusC/RagA family TonB-linked outer membrane protein, partial [Saprospiraceae bacterium]|nr:SusC/RagA family TonB-linked outer membrane protein [Saprospiraceae bacterium]